MDKKEETRRFESEMLALPPLKMVLVYGGAQNAEKSAKKSAALNKSSKRFEEIAAVVRLIDHLTEEDSVDK